MLIWIFIGIFIVLGFIVFAVWCECDLDRLTELAELEESFYEDLPTAKRKDEV